MTWRPALLGLSGSLLFLTLGADEPPGTILGQSSGTAAATVTAVGFIILGLFDRWNQRKYGEKAMALKDQEIAGLTAQVAEMKKQHAEDMASVKAELAETRAQLMAIQSRGWQMSGEKMRNDAPKDPTA